MELFILNALMNRKFFHIFTETLKKLDIIFFIQFQQRQRNLILAKCRRHGAVSKKMHRVKLLTNFCKLLKMFNMVRHL